MLSTPADPEEKMSLFRAPACCNRLGLITALAAGLCWTCSGQTLKTVPPVLNLSTDLVNLPPPYRQTNNMRPDDSSLDSTPLLNSAIAYVSQYNTQNPDAPFTLVTVEQGKYYFKNTFPGATYYGFISGLTGVTIDLKGSALYFANSLDQGFNISDCTGCTFQNFSIDYQTLPFTQLSVQNVSANGTIVVDAETGFVNAYELSQTQTSASLYGFDFRNGQPQYANGRWNVSVQASNPNSLALAGDVSSIRPGDTFVVEARGGGPAILVVSSRGTALKNITVYSSGQVGIVVRNIFNNNVSFNGVSIIPGAGRLVSTNADGISFQQPGANNSINNCQIALTQDDGISMVCWPIGAVCAVSAGGSVLALQNTPIQIDVPYSAGTAVYFVDPISCLPVARSSIEQVLPGNSVRVNPAVPDVGTGFLVFDADENHRGNGLSIRGNRIGPTVFARGISVFGLTGVTIEENTISSTQQAGVLMMNQLNNPASWVSGPNYNIAIVGNSLEYTNWGTGPLVPEMLAAIQLRTLNAENSPSPVITEPNQGIVIYNSQITSSPRSGIWLENASSGAVSANILTNTGFDPFVPQDSTLFGLSGAKAVLDFRTPVVIQSSHVAVGVNTCIQ
jgi:hypothetical protein